MVVRMLIAYDGTAYCGFQVQPAVPTVQGSIESVLSKVLQSDVRVACAGRTDAGVHATGQVISFEAPDTTDPMRLAGALNGLLPGDISVIDHAVAPDDFHARHSANARSYVYLVDTADAARPFLARFAHHDPRAIDASIASAALDRFRGERDFTSFVRLAEGDNPVRHVYETWVDETDGIVRLGITAKSFLHQMVRGIVGTVLEVAAGRRPVDWIDEAFEARDRAAAGPVAPAKGLALTSVGYEDIDWTTTSDLWPWARATVAA